MNEYNIQPTQEQERLQGRVLDIVFQSPDSGYTVARFKSADDEFITIVGTMPGLAAGESVEAFGNYITHPQFGRQFQVKSYESFMPQDAVGIYEYLASGGIKGIGAKTARLIVEKFDKQAFEVIANNPETLATIKGISLQKAYSIQRRFLESGALRNIIEFLALHRLPAYFAGMLLKKYDTDATEVITRNPYLLCEEPFNQGFRDIDALALQFGISGDDTVRVCGGILCELSFNLGNGHTFIPLDKLVSMTSQLVAVSENAVLYCIDQLCREGRIIRDTVGSTDVIYLDVAYRWETLTANEITRLINTPVAPPRGLEKKLSRLESQGGISYAEGQIQAILSCFNSAVSIITGGPGTGKTTALLTAIELMEECGYTCLLAAPTGRAADRMTKITGRPASTIHRLLEAIFSENGTTVFRRNRQNPIDADYIIVDEASMIDISISAALLEALKAHTRLVLVGDVDQLPPVGPGSFFRDLINCGRVPTTRLTEIFRQAQNSDIVLNAHKINEGEMPPLRKNTGDFYFTSCRTALSAAETVGELMCRRIPSHFGIEPENIQVICPSRRNICGTEEMNILLQSKVNPPTDDCGELKLGRVTFREGDKVMQTKNNYDRCWNNPKEGKLGAGIYNGDMGIITHVDSRGKILHVSFDGRQAEYGLNELDELEHAFAITAHKSQGSEYSAVIIPLFDCPPRLMVRNLLYTAVTRAKELLVLVGREDVIEQMVVHSSVPKRYTALKRRIGG